MTLPPHIRKPFARFAAFATFAVAAGVVGSAAPPEVEDPKPKPPLKKIAVEDEDPKGAVKKKVVVDDPDPQPAPGGSAPDVKLDELTRAGSEATHPALKAILTRYAVPFDRLTDAKGEAVRIRPIPAFRGDRFPKQIGVADLGADGRPKEVRSVATGDVKRVDYFEELVLAEAEDLLKSLPAVGKDDPPADERDAAAEKLLAAALRFHDYARDNPFAGLPSPIRPGKTWEPLRASLAARLREVRVKQLRRAVAASDWPRARAAGTTLMAAYPKDAAAGKEVAEARVAEAAVLVRTKAFADQVKARELLDEFDARFPGAGGEPARAVRRELAAEAARLFERARGFKAAGNLADARNDVARGDALDPTVPGLRELKRELGAGSPVLYVGARTLPERMSPATARLDSERQAVELLFEGLLEEVPDAAGGVRYRPGAARGYPAGAAVSRDFLLHQVRRAENSPEGFDAADVAGTVKLLRGRPDLWPAAGLPWVADLPPPPAGGGVRVGFRHGHPDPRALLTFKLLPARWLAARDLPADDPGFAAKPFGTGPYRVHSLPPPGATGPREVVFADNPAYARSKDRTNQPVIREIRFVEVPRLADPLADFRAGKLHILPDLTPAEMARATSQNGLELAGKGRVYTAAAHRRVYVLALNLRRPPLRNKDLRKGLSQAIDREGVLNDVFRTAAAEYRRLTAAMTGPFPPNSWATVKGPSGRGAPLVNRDEATVRLKRYLMAAGAAAELRLAYAADDPLAAVACDKIKAHVESLFKDAAENQKLTLVLDPLPARELLLRTEEERRFDLAYVPFDYPDDWHPFGLAAFLDPAAAGRGGRNLTGFLAPDTTPDAADRALGGELAGLLVHRDYAGDTAPRAARIHTQFNDSVPFVPLWQLDRHTLVHGSVKVFTDDGPDPVLPSVLDPTVLFQNVARWRLE